MGLPWYLHVYHAAWLLAMLLLGHFVSWLLVLTVVSTIALLAFFYA